MGDEGIDVEAGAMAGLGCVVVSPDGPDDGGHFGRNTPGTKTSGLQEAFDYAEARRRDIYIVGGAMPARFTAGAHYELQDTLHIPPMHDFRLDGGEYNLVYPREAGFAVVLDSVRDSHLKFGKVISHSREGGVAWFRPQTPGPDGVAAIRGCSIEFGAALGGGGAIPGEGVRGHGTGILFDSSHGDIEGNRISSIEVVGCDRGLHMKGPNVRNNEIQVLWSHINTTHLRLGDPGAAPSHNRITMDAMDSEGMRGGVGADVFGANNLLTLTSVRMDPGRDLVFEPDARANLVVAIDLPNGFTNLAITPTNRIVPCWPVGFEVETPSVPRSGETVSNRNPYRVEVILVEPGDVAGHAVDGQPVPVASFAGQRVVLDPGQNIALDYQHAPAWRWRALV